MPTQSNNNEPSDQDVTMGGQEDALKPSKSTDGTSVCVAFV